MANLTVSEFRAIRTGFSSVPDQTIQDIITITLCSFDQDRWDCQYKRGHSAYVAHVLALDSQQSGGNSSSDGMDSVSGQAADGVSVSYAVYTPENASDAYFMGTSYGREYLMLLNIVGIGGIALCSN